jgi:H/ACA ribonucleoprotein complex non-core subunit NAF1
MSANVQPAFKVPECIPQDLLLIQELVGEVSISQPTNSQKATILLKPEVEDDDINSSGSDDDSEDELDEVEAHLLVTGEEGNGVLPPVKA